MEDYTPINAVHLLITNMKVIKVCKKCKEYKLHSTRVQKFCDECRKEKE